MQTEDWVQILPSFNRNVKNPQFTQPSYFSVKPRITAILPSRHRWNCGDDRRRDHCIFHGTVEGEREGQQDRHQGDGGEEFHVQRRRANRSVLQVAKPILL